ncbi:hypothetical protein E2C01_012697 [Portunus trituberculatus]|uniref:Uncharacterized protein n=1 Tax=Portunus trituberculatus TaxID=210409 RepID=A0A5B7DEB7_PORTR|nr:hypothetical protein [Portunus trituberculatus]
MFSVIASAANSPTLRYIYIVIMSVLVKPVKRRTLLWSANNNKRGQQIARSTVRSADCMLGHHAGSDLCYILNH